MVNASLNWASIVGIVLAVCGAGLYFLRSFKPALARDYDVFFAAIGLLCGGILFFQGWRLDPILQFGQFLLAGTTVFFAYESVRLRGLATDQARRSSYFDDDSLPERMPSDGSFRERWDEPSYNQFDEPLPLRRRFVGRENDNIDSVEEQPYRPRRASRAAIPEQAVSRNSRSRAQGQELTDWKDDSEQTRRMSRFSRNPGESENRTAGTSFGERRNMRQEQRRGSRPATNKQTPNRPNTGSNDDLILDRKDDAPRSTFRQVEPRKGSSSAQKVEDAAFYPSNERKRSVNSQPSNNSSQKRSSTYSQTSKPRSSSRTRRRDNSSRFDN